MTTRLYVRRPVLYGGDHIELTDDYGPRRGAPFFDSSGGSLVELGMRCAEGEASQGTFLFTDPYADPDADPFATSFPLAHNLVTWTEDAPGAEVWLFRGRVVTDEGGRRDAVIDHETEWEITVEDGNAELRGQAFAEHWVRPEETDVARLLALQAFILNGSSSTAVQSRDSCQVTVSTSHLAPNSNTVTMPAKKYVAGTQPLDVVRDCAQTAGKNFAVVIHHTGGSHLCLFYTVPGDNSTYTSPIKISDHLADWDPEDLTAPIFEPHWERGDATLFQMQTMTSGLVGVWGSSEQFTFVEDTAVRDNYEYWVDTAHTSAATAAEADDKAAGELFLRKQLQVTHRVSIIMLPEQVDMVGAGMSIQMRTAATHDPDVEAYVTRRICECRFEPRIDGRYWCHMDIERPILLNPRGPGYSVPIPPVQSEPPTSAVTDYIWTLESSPNEDVTGLYPCGSASNSTWHPGLCHAHVLNPGIGVSGVPISPGTYHFRAISQVGCDFSYGSKGMRVEAFNAASTVIFTHDFPEHPDSGIYTDEADLVFPAGTTKFGFGSYSIANANNCFQIYEAELTHGGSGDSFIGTPPPPAPTDGLGDIGTSPIYSPSDHQHGWQTAENTPVADAGGFFAGANVEEVLQELSSGAALSWKPPVRVATTAAGTLASSFENGDTVDGITLATDDRILIKDQASGAENGIYTVNASGAPTRAVDFDDVGKAEGAAVLVREGTANADTVFVCTTDGTITIGTTATVWAAVSGSAGTLNDLTDVVITSPADGQVLTYDSGGSQWVNEAPTGGGGGTEMELDYAQITSTANPTATTEGTANTVITGNAVTYDGATTVLVEFFSPYARPDDTTNGRELRIYLYEDGSSIGRMALYIAGQGGGPAPGHIAKRRITPSAGSHTYSIRASVNAGTGTILAGAGGSGNDMPAYMRIVKSIPAVSGASVQTNEVRNFPSLENADNAQPEWWEESAGTATLTEVDLAGEGITESWERALKLVTTADVHALQTYTYADEKRLKSGKTVSARVAVWAVGGVTARVRLQSTVGSLGVSTTTAAAWTVLTVEGVVLDGTAVDLRLEVNNGTAYFVPLAFGVGSSAPNELPPRSLVYRNSITRPTVESLTGSTGKALADVDLTANTSALAALANLHIDMEEGTSGEIYSYGTRPNGSSIASASGAIRRAVVSGDNAENTASQWTEILDDGQIFESELIRNTGGGSIAGLNVYLDGWWEWA